jgi:hypothetical protein
MDIQPQSTQPISDDQELAKVLAGVNAEGDEAASGVPAVSEVTPPVAPGEPPVVAPVADDVVASDTPAVPDYTAPADPVGPAPVSPTAIPVGGELDGVKSQAISELRPLVDKLTLPPEEKFDTYLLLIRSTDDKSLIAPAHEAAREITDEARRAQALLDIIKEIDFLSGQQQA